VLGTAILIDWRGERETAVGLVVEVDAVGGRGWEGLWRGCEGGVGVEEGQALKSVVGGGGALNSTVGRSGACCV
jgi:hypothetical protein